MTYIDSEAAFKQQLAIIEGKEENLAAIDLQRLEAEADRILGDEAIPALQRLIHLRSFADGLDTRVNDSELRQTLWSARRRANGSATPHGKGAQLSLKAAPWLWEGVVMEGTTNLVVALPKVGKSRLFTQFIGQLAAGQPTFLGQPLKGPCPPVLIVGSDQPESDWALCLHLAGLLPNGAMHNQIVALYDKGRPLHLDDKGIEEITQHCSQNPGLLILLDSYYSCVQCLGLQEKDSNYAGPLLDLQEAIAPFGATLIVIHHSNKASGSDGEASSASRGTTALPGAVSQTISLARLPKPSPLAPADRRIRLKTEGRAGQPLELLIEQVEEGRAWISHGDAETVARRTAAEEVVDGLNDRQAQAIEDFTSHWHATGEPMDAQQLAAALALEGANPEARAREVITSLARVGLLEKAGDRPAAGGRGGKTGKLYRPTEVALSLYPPEASIPSIASNDLPNNAIDALDGVNFTREGQSTLDLASLPCRVAVGSHWDATADGDDPHWGPKPSVPRDW